MHQAKTMPSPAPGWLHQENKDSRGETQVQRRRAESGPSELDGDQSCIISPALVLGVEQTSFSDRGTCVGPGTNSDFSSPAVFGPLVTASPVLVERIFAPMQAKHSAEHRLTGQLSRQVLSSEG